MKKILAIIIATSMLFPMVVSAKNSTIPEILDNTTTSSDHKNGNYSFSNVRGVSFAPSNRERIISDESEINFNMDSLKFTINKNVVNLHAKINGDSINFKPVIYPSQFSYNAANTLIGIDDSKKNGKYSLVSFRIEQKADSISLLEPNRHMEGKTILALAFHNAASLETVYFQMLLENVELGDLFANAKSMYNEKVISVDDLITKEVEYLTLDVDKSIVTKKKSVESTKEFSSKVDDIQSGDEMPDDTAAWNDLKERSKDGYVMLTSTRSLITNVEDSILRNLKVNDWSNDWGIGANTHGHIIYATHHFGGPNKLLYVIRFKIVTQFGPIVIPSFTVVDNVWVSHKYYTNELGIWDDRSENGGILVSPALSVEIDDETSSTYQGTITYHRTKVVQRGSFLPVIARALIRFIPHISEIYDLGEDVYTKGVYVETDTLIPHGNYTKKITAEAKDLQKKDDRLVLEAYNNAEFVKIRYTIQPRLR